MKKILIINRNNTDNIGDKTIGIAMQALVKEISSAKVYSADLTTERHLNNRLSRAKHSVYKLVARLGGREFVWKMENRGLFKVLDKNVFDLVLIGGGELVQSNKIFPKALDTWTYKIKIKQPQAKIYLFGVGVTSHFSIEDKKHLLNMLKRINGVVVRDQMSKDNLLNQYGIESKVIPDVVYSLRRREEKDGTPYRSGVLYGLTNWERIKKYGLYASSREEYYKKTLEAIPKNGKLFYTTETDHKECLCFQSYAKNNNVDLEIAYYDDIDALFSLLQTKEAVYSPRMHGCIIADLCGCRTEPILVSPKMESYKATYKKPLDFIGMQAKIVEELKLIFENNDII